jgi:hypothetical protein
LRDHKKGDVFDIYTFTGISRRTFDAARRKKREQFTESTFNILVGAVGCESPDKLRRFLSPPASRTVSPTAIQEPATHKDAGDRATSANARTDYERAISTTSNNFSVFIMQLDIFAPISLARHLDGPILELLRYASAAIAVLIARPRIKDASLTWSTVEQESFVFLSFVAMVRGYLLDRFVARKDLAPEVLPTLPEWSVLQRRWYENVLLENRWLHDWSDNFSRDLVDAQWPAVERELNTLPQSDVLPMPILMNDLKQCMLLGMVARRFLMLADSTVSGSVGESVLRTAINDETMPPDARQDGTAGKSIPPEIQKRLDEPATFRDIVPKSWQRLPLVECPRPHPVGNNSTPPFQRNLGGDIYYVAGWNIRLRANTHYRVTCDFVRNNVWPEIEIILYERVPRTESWKRAESFGAVTSGNGASDVTPQVEEWLITCWGKNVIADNAPWYDFVPDPEAFDLDSTAGLLKLHFSAPKRQVGEGGLPVSTVATGFSPAVHMRVVE